MDRDEQTEQVLDCLQAVKQALQAMLTYTERHAEASRRMAEVLNRHRKRREGDAADKPEGEAPAKPASPPPPRRRSLERNLSDNEIEAVAVKAVAMIAGYHRWEQECAWEQWRHDLESRYPPYAAIEIARRAGELWKLLRD
jgi:ferric-dicitrate binding protein FerR (iron transport regulator)